MSHNKSNATKHHSHGAEEVSVENTIRSNCCHNNDFEPTMTIYHGSNCNNINHEEHHHDHGCCCCCCCCPYSPIPLTPCCSICEQQMKIVLDQLITLYPVNTYEINFEDGGTASGTPDSILTDINKGVLCINCDTTLKEYLNIGKIASLKVSDEIYSPTIQFLPAPIRPNISGCEESLRSILVVGTNVIISLAGKDLVQGVVVADEFGMVIIQSGEDLQFIATCKIEKVRIIANP